MSCFYYGVRLGRVPGVYTNWPATKAQVYRYSRADYRKFYTETGAQYYVDDPYVNVYTDGCCYDNGRYGSRAGIGVWFDYDHHLNLCERLDGLQTNNRAEIHAAIRAVEQASDYRDGIEGLILNTDSRFLVDSINIWMKRWKRQGWMRSCGKPVINTDDFLLYDDVVNNWGMPVIVRHIPAHAGYDGNEQADRLAKEGANLQCPCCY